MVRTVLRSILNPLTCSILSWLILPNSTFNSFPILQKFSLQYLCCFCCCYCCDAIANPEFNNLQFRLKRKANNLLRVRGYCYSTSHFWQSSILTFSFVWYELVPLPVRSTNPSLLGFHHPPKSQIPFFKCEFGSLDRKITGTWIVSWSEFMKQESLSTWDSTVRCIVR